MTAKLKGPLTWSLTEDEKGFKDYKIKFRVRSAKTDGPKIVKSAPGLPIPWVTTWNYFDDVDNSAICRRNLSITPFEKEGDPTRWWDLDYLFSNKPDERCGQHIVDINPLAEPPKINVTFSKQTEEGTYDRFGERIVNSAHEQIRGPQNEWDVSTIVVTIKQQMADPRFLFLCLMEDGVNEDTMWGFPPRCVKLGEPQIELNYWKDCRVYYTRSLKFEIKYRAKDGVSSTGTGTGTGTGAGGVGTPVFDGEYETWDRDLLDEGTKVLNGKWAATGGNWIRLPVGGGVLNPSFDNLTNPTLPLNPDPANPKHFIRFKDRQGENCRVILNGEGIPAGVVVGSGTGTASALRPGTIHVEKYPSCNFWILDIPSEIIPISDWTGI